VTPDDLAALLRATAVDVLTGHGLDTAALPSTVTVERPRNPAHGDYATNLALQLSKRVGADPRELAGWLAAALVDADGVASTDVAGPGFVNVRLGALAQGGVVTAILADEAGYGCGHAMAGVRVNLEFVSANPTGPLHLGHTRWAAVGDALGRILTAQSAQVTREYYFNDAGAQIDRFVRSLIAVAQHEPIPADGYSGAYLADIVVQVLAHDPEVLELDPVQRHERFRVIGVGLMFDEIKAKLHEFGTDFDVFFHERSLFDTGASQRAVQTLKNSGRLFNRDGAWWLRSTEFGDDKDRVVIKSNGEPAYIAGDIAYFQDKRSRGFDLCIYLLGADHHGYIHRLKAAAAAFGDDPASVEVLIGQMVNLKSGGQTLKMSKRAGTVVTLDDLVDAVGVDAARYALIRSSVDSNIDIDLDLWSAKSSDNPVFYVQYAHARLSSLTRSARDLGITWDAPDVGLLAHEKEGPLIRALGQWPRVVASACDLREPHRVARYLEQLAADYHRFYDSCRVLPQGDEPAGELHRARLALCAATRQVLANGLGMLGVTAPERM